MFGFLILYTVPSIYFYITYTNSLWTNQVEIHWTIAPKAGEMKSMLHNLHVGIIDEKKNFIVAMTTPHMPLIFFTEQPNVHLI